MSAPPSPAFSEISIAFCCSEEDPGSDGNADSDNCSPQLKRAKPLISGQTISRVEESLKKKFFNPTFLSGVQEIDSWSSTRRVGSHSCGIERDGSSSHSLPVSDCNKPAPSNSLEFGRRLSLESVRCDGVDSGNNSAKERQSSLEDNADRVVEAEQAKNDRKTRVVSSYYSHLKENLLPNQESDQCSYKIDMTASTPRQRDKETAKGKFGLCEITYESGENAVRGTLLPEPLETLVGSRDLCDNWSTTNSLQEDDVPNGLKLNETPEPTETASTLGRAGDPGTWNSHVEKEYRNELEFSTLVTLAYVRVRDLTNTINKASSYLETIDQKDVEDAEETNDLRSEIQAMFEERAALALEHSKWRSEFSEVYLRRKKVLSNLKSQAALAEQSYFQLRKELEDLQNEPIVAKPKRTWFSRLCAFIK